MSKWITEIDQLKHLYVAHIWIDQHLSNTLYRFGKLAISKNVASLALCTDGSRAIRSAGNIIFSVTFLQSDSSSGSWRQRIKTTLHSLYRRCLRHKSTFMRNEKAAFSQLLCPRISTTLKTHHHYFRGKMAIFQSVTNKYLVCPNSQTNVSCQCILYML